MFRDDVTLHNASSKGSAQFDLKEGFVPCFLRDWDTCVPLASEYPYERSRLARRSYGWEVTLVFPISVF